MNHDENEEMYNQLFNLVDRFKELSDRLVTHVQLALKLNMKNMDVNFFIVNLDEFSNAQFSCPVFL